MTSTTSIPMMNELDMPRAPWWLVLIVGIATLGVGILMIANPLATLISVVLFLGVYWLISGVFTIGSLFVDRTAWGWKLFVGILGIVAGLAVIDTPLWSAILIPAIAIIFLGVQGLISGVVELYTAFRQRDWGLGILGAINVLFGIFLVANPLVGVAVLPWVLGFLGVMGGIAAIVLAFRMR
jgi:uncharacterized membrane protein HdeD (DUF308 family)